MTKLNKPKDNMLVKSTINRSSETPIERVKWEALQTCDPTCPLFLTCPHNTYDDKDYLFSLEPEDFLIECTNKCSLRKSYLKSVHKSLVNIVPVKTWESEMKIGLFLVPLYSHLITFKIIEHSLKGRVYTNRGTMNPIYKEMRETMRTINGVLRELGVNPKDRKSDNSYVNGDSSYYDSLVDGEVAV